MDIVHKRRRRRQRVDVSETEIRELAIAERALDLWLCWHAASPHEVIPHVLRTLAGGACSEAMVEAISKAASDWTRQRYTYHPSDAVIIVEIARRDARK
jgi:hypothetical protein